MSWLRFMYWTLGLYAFYYLANIAWDLLRRPRNALAETPELTFSDPVQPQKVAAPPAAPPEKAGKRPAGEPVISAIGGVALKDLFNLAKAEVIAYNRAVSF